jgi:hypothetical protein
VDAYDVWPRAIITGILFAYGFSVLTYSKRQPRTDLRKQFDLIWPWWDYALAVYFGIVVVIMDGFFYRLSREAFVVLAVFVAVPAISRFFLARHVRRANANFSR